MSVWCLYILHWLCRLVPLSFQWLAFCYKKLKLCVVCVCVCVCVLEMCILWLKVHSHQTQIKRYARMIYMLSQCKGAIDNPAALFARMRWRIERLTRKLKNLNFGGYSCRVTNLELALAMTWNNKEDKLILLVCGYSELYDTTLYFYKNRNIFCNETGAAWQKPLPWREFTSVV